MPAAARPARPRRNLRAGGKLNPEQRHPSTTPATSEASRPTCQSSSERQTPSRETSRAWSSARQPRSMPPGCGRTRPCPSRGDVGFTECDAAADPDDDPPGPARVAGFGGVPNHGLMPWSRTPARGGSFCRRADLRPAARSMQLRRQRRPPRSPASCSGCGDGPSTSMRSFTPTLDLRPSRPATAPAMSSCLEHRALAGT